jgi:hypothetical protein
VTDRTLLDRLRADRAPTVVRAERIPPAAVEAGAWSEITKRARTFAAALTARRER